MTNMCEEMVMIKLYDPKTKLPNGQFWYVKKTTYDLIKDKFGTSK